MKQLWVTTLLTGLLGLVLTVACKKSKPSTPSDSVHLKQGLMLYLPFNGSMADSSGNNNLTTPLGGLALTYDEHGYANSAIGGTGNGARLLVTNNGSIQYDTAFSVSVDFTMADLRNQALIGIVDNTTGYSPSFNLGLMANNTTRFSFYVADSAAGCGNWGSTTLGVHDTTSFIPAVESWYNAVCIYHKGTVNTYINGVLISSETGTGTKALLCSTDNVIIGGWWSNSPVSFNGKIDNVRLYNRVLNADEIARLASLFQPAEVNKALGGPLNGQSGNLQ